MKKLQKEYSIQEIGEYRTKRKHKIKPIIISNVIKLRKSE